MNVLQMFLAGSIAVTALYVVGTHGAGIAQTLGGATTFVSGTLKSASGQNYTPPA